MKIRALRVRNVGRFAAPVAVEGLSGRLDVLAEGNEFGKSTLFRAIESVFLVKHSASGKQVDALRSAGGGEPLIEADFEADGRLWRIRKQFGRGKSAELCDAASGVLESRGGDAEDQLARLVGTVDGKPSRLGLLWVGQKGSLARAEPDLERDRGERSAIERIVAREVETVASGSEARAVRARVGELLVPLSGGRQGQPKLGSDFDKALRERDRLAVALRRAEAAATAVSGWLDRLEALAARRAALEGPDGLLIRLEKAVAEAAAGLGAARDARQRLDRAERTRAEVAARHAAAKRSLADIDDRLQELQRLAAAEAEGGERVRLLEADAAGAQAVLAEAQRQREALAEIERALVAALAEDDAYRRRHAIAERLERSSRALSAVQRIEGEIATAERAIAASPVDAAALARVEARERDAQRLADRLDAAAPVVAIVPEAGAAGRIRVGGTPLQGAFECVARGPLRIEIAGVGTIVVTPGASSGTAEAAGQLAAVRDALGAALVELGAASPDDARRLRRARGEAEEALAAARRSLATLAPEGSAALEREVEAMTRHRASAPAGALIDDRAAAEVRLDGARRELASASEAEADARGRCHAAETALAAAVATAAGIAAARAAVERELPSGAVRDAERARLAAAVAAVAPELDAAIREATLLKDLAPDGAMLERLEAQERQAAVALRKGQDEAQEIARDVAGLEARLDESVKDGDDMRPEAARDALALADAAVSRFARRTRALQRLALALDVAENQWRARFQEPVAARLRPYLAELFADAAVEFGDGFRAAALVRGGSGEAIERLSDGTQEQLAILVRLAFGRLLSDGGAPAPVILDDALVYSDDERIGRMFRVLEQAASVHQVLVLTCRSQLFGRLGGHRVALVPWRA